MGFSGEKCLTGFLEDIYPFGMALAGGLGKGLFNSHGPRTARSRYLHTYRFNLISCSENGFFRREVPRRHILNPHEVGWESKQGNSNTYGDSGRSRRENNTSSSNGKADPFDKEKVLLRSQTNW